ncbi:ventricular zone-expressed PH domain-containing protein 1-like [Saccoglossus kowalevskii]|uniref:Ventricular zone-expressed pH domain-containing protein-like 222 n=2 Tax=Saccoglossus kowalevskii TaxID=10224 RepID=A0A0U2K785_SACKO|nr:ventricular zone-expressed pH domain-containing protein-like 222 [Saccoglossus kowalevskii]
MHLLFAQVLAQRDLSRAGDLFSIDDKEIVDDLSEVLMTIKDISSSEDYLNNDNDQAVVEICITRVTTAIKETGSINDNATALVLLWQSCLEYNLKPINRDEDSPHAKIASDIMSCLFMNYSNKAVMELAVPVAVKFLEQGNKEITRNMSSYLSLVAIESASLLARHTIPIIQSIVKGTRSLTRILPQIYAEEPKSLNDHVTVLIDLLPVCDSTETNNVLQLIGLVAKQDAKLLEPHVSTLAEHLKITATAQAVLISLIDMASTNAAPLATCLPALKDAVRIQSTLMSLAAKLFGAVGRLNQAYGKECIAFLVSQLPYVDRTTLAAVLIEIKSIGDQYPGLLGEHQTAISKQGESLSTAARMIVQQLREDIAKCDDTAVVMVESLTASTCEATSQTDSADHNDQDAKSETLSVEKDVIKKAESTTSVKHSHEHLNDSLSEKQTSLTGATTTTQTTTTMTTTTTATSSSSVSGLTVEQTNNNTSNTKLTESKDDSATKGSSQTDTISNIVERPPSANSRSPSNSSQATSAVVRKYSTEDKRESRSNLKIDGLQGSGKNKHRDSGIQQYLAHRHKEITSYMDSVRPRIPVPQECLVEEGYSSRTFGRLEFYCGKKGPHCLFNKSPFIHTTRNLQPWVHLMFLELQASSSTSVSLDDDGVQNLKACWEQQKKGGPIPFTRLITQPFPILKVQDHLIDELTDISYFDVFVYNKSFETWLCFLCNNPDKASGLLHEGQPMIEGCLKEKKVRWKLFKRWKTRYFTLAGEQLVGSKSKSSKPSVPIELGKIQSVKTLRKRDRSIPRAFEIFTNERTYVLKPKDGQNAEQWVQCLTLAMRHHACKGTFNTS